MANDASALDPERADLLHALRGNRNFLRTTARGLTDDQARHRSTVSALCIGGLIKHVAQVEEHWADFIMGGPEATEAPVGDAMAAHQAGFVMGADDTLAGLLEMYDRVAARTDELVATLESLDADHALPDEPWFPPGARWTNRFVLIHIAAETAQHAGHADIIREAMDGAKTMG